MVYFISTVSLILLITVDAFELDEITYLPSTYWPMLRYASSPPLAPSSSSSASTSPSALRTPPNVPFKRQGIIPGPRVGRRSSYSSPTTYSSDDYSDLYYRYNSNSPNPSINNNNNYKNNNNNNNYKSNKNRLNNNLNNHNNIELHELISSLTGYNTRGKRSLRVNDMISSASSSSPLSSSSPSSPSSSSTGSAVDVATTLEDNASPNSMAMFTRSARQLIPAPRVGRSSASASTSPSSSSYLLPNLYTGFSSAASTYNRVSSDDELNSYETDQQVGFNSNGLGVGASTRGGGSGGIQLLAVPRNYLTPMMVKDLFKRVALTPRIGRSDHGSSSASFIGSNAGGWLDDDDYYNRVIKSSFTPRVGRSVDANGEKSAKSSKP